MIGFEHGVPTSITTHEVADLLSEGLFALANEGDRVAEHATVTTYEEAGLLTQDAGLVIRTADGSEFQITIVRSA